MAIQLTFPSTWLRRDAVGAIKAASKVLEHVARYKIKNEALAYTRSSMRSFASRALVGKPPNAVMSPVDSSELRNLITNTVKLGTRVAAEAGIPQPPVQPVQRWLNVAVRRESAFSGAFGEPAVLVM